MTPTQSLLFGTFPRDGGIPTRFPLFSKRHFDSFMEKAGGDYNLYCAISRFDYPKYYCDKVFYDFDAKWDGLFDIGKNPPEKFNILRQDPDLADKFLGEVVTEARDLVRASIDDGIPVIGAFTGKGIHVYQLFQEMESPRKEMLSTANKYKEELGFDYLDPKPIGDVMRIARIPGSRRLWNDRICPIYTTPLMDSEMLEMDAEWLLSISSSPRVLDISPPRNRPQMETHEEYLNGYRVKMPQQEFDPDEINVDNDFLQWYIRRIIRMPCVSERALTHHPSHEVRLNFAVHLFNAGLTPKTVLDIVSQLNWSDFDRKTTKKQLKQIYRRGYREFSCQRMQDEGLCVHSDNPGECPAYGRISPEECRW